MDKLLKHIPEIDDESGDEYAWSKIIGRIKSKKQEWKEIENLIASKALNKQKGKQFVQRLLDGLIEIKTERFISTKHEKYGKKSELVADLEGIEENISKLQKSFWHREYHDFLYAHLSKGDHVFEDGANETAAIMQQIEDNLQEMRAAAKKAIKHYKSKKELRPHHSTYKKELKDDLAYFIECELNKAGIRPAETRNGTFDKVFCLSCNIIELKPNSAGSQHIKKAVNSLKKKSI